MTSTAKEPVTRASRESPSGSNPTSDLAGLAVILVSAGPVAAIAAPGSPDGGRGAGPAGDV